MSEEYEELLERLRHEWTTPDKQAAADAIDRLTRERDELQAQLLHTTEWNTQWLLGHKERLAEATARAERAEAALREIADQELYNVALDTEWPRRIARAAIAQKDAAP